MPKTKQQFDDIKQSRKQHIMNCALKVFCEKGYSGAKIDDITKKAKCSHGLFYHYFPTKKNLFEEVMKAKKALVQQDTMAKMEGEPLFKNKLKILTNQIFNDIKNDENASYYFYFFVTQCFHRKEKAPPPPPKDENGQVRKPFFLYIVDFFQQGKDSGQLSVDYTPFQCAEMLVSIIQGASLGYAIAPKRIQKKIQLPDVDFITNIFFKGDVDEN